MFEERMARNLEEEVAQYAHSPVHFAIVLHDYAALRRILVNLPCLPKAGEVVSESESIAAEKNADTVSATIDRRDVPGRETPLHLAVRLGDSVAVEMLMAAGADWSLQNEQGWSALQEAVCAREEGIAMIITRYYQPMAWAKWCRRLPRITAAMRRMRDFYMEITFNFESSVIPFIGRIAPSDTYRIWKRGSNLRADMTLAGFDGFKIQRSDQSFLFLGEGSEDGKLPPGSLLVLTHKDKEVTNALEGAGTRPSEAEIAQEVAVMSQTNMYRPGIDVTQAELVPQVTWRRQEKTEMVGQWKAKVFDMHHVMVSVRSRRVPGAMTDEELFAAESERQDDDQEADFANTLTEEEKQQLENALIESLELSEEGQEKEQSRARTANGDFDHTEDSVDNEDEYGSAPSPGADRNGASEAVSSSKEGKRGWLFDWGKKTTKKDGSKKPVAMRNDNGIEESTAEKIGENAGSSSGAPVKASRKLVGQANESNRKSIEKRPSDVQNELIANTKKGKEKTAKRIGSSKDSVSKRKTSPNDNGNVESEYKKGLRPVLWLTPDFPLKTEELLPLLDILASKVKAVRRLRELLTTKLPSGTFPVKVAIPIIPTIRVVVTFNKFEELGPSEEFCTPLSSPAHFQDSKAKEVETLQSSSSWFSWIRGSQDQAPSTSVCLEDHFEEEVDPFSIPSDYTWVDVNEKKRRLKVKKSKTKKGKKISSRSAEGVESEGE